MATAAAPKRTQDFGNCIAGVRRRPEGIQQGDRFTLVKYSVKLDKLLFAERAFAKRLIFYSARCNGSVSPVGTELLSKRELEFPELLLVANVYDNILSGARTKLEREFASIRLDSFRDDRRALEERIRRRSLDLRAALWKQLPQETQKLTTYRDRGDLGITVTAKSTWDIYAWTEEISPKSHDRSCEGEWKIIGTEEGQHEKSIPYQDWIDAITKKILGVPGVIDRKDGCLNVDKIPEVPAVLEIARLLAPVFAHARAEFFVTQLTQQLRYRSDQATRFNRVEMTAISDSKAISQLVLGVPEILFAEIRRYRASQRAMQEIDLCALPVSCDNPLRDQN